MSDDICMVWYWRMTTNVALTQSSQVESVKVTTRLSSSPAIVTGHESGALRRMMQTVDTQAGAAGSDALTKQTLEINAKHPIIRRIDELSKAGGAEEEMAKLIAEQVSSSEGARGERRTVQ